MFQTLECLWGYSSEHDLSLPPPKFTFCSGLQLKISVMSAVTEVVSALWEHRGKASHSKVEESEKQRLSGEYREVSQEGWK